MLSVSMEWYFHFRCGAKGEREFLVDVWKNTCEWRPVAIWVKIVQLVASDRLIRRNWMDYRLYLYSTDGIYRSHLFSSNEKLP